MGEGLTLERREGTVEGMRALGIALGLGVLTFVVFLVILLLVVGCGPPNVTGVEGAIKIGRCEVVIEDTLGPEVPEAGGPLDRDAYQSGLVCDVVRW